MNSDEPFSTDRVDGFIILAAHVDLKTGYTELYYHDDDDTFVTLDTGKPYEVYVSMISRTVYLPQPTWYPVPKTCPVTGERWD